jgi:hypothetical protein
MFGAAPAELNLPSLCTDLHRQMLKMDATLKSLDAYTNAYMERQLQR